MQPIGSDLFIDEIPNFATFKGQLKDVAGNGIYGTIQSLTDQTIYFETDLDGYFEITIPTDQIFEFRSVGFNPLKLNAFHIREEIILKYSDDNTLDVVNVTGKLKKNGWKWVLGASILGFILLKSEKSISKEFEENEKKKADKKKGLGKSATCKNRIKCTGLTKDGKLKKGYKYAGGGKVVKATPRKSKRKGLGQTINFSI